MTSIDNGTIDYKNEVIRKSIHLCSLSIPVVYYFISRELALSVLIPLALLSLLIDVGRFFYPPLKKVFYLFFGFLLRKHEKDENKKNLSGATYVFISAVVVVLLFPKIFVITGFAVLIIGDIFAALIGRKFGRHKFLYKSLEGTSAFFISSCIVVLLTPKLTNGIDEYLIGFVAVAFGAIAENLSSGWLDDNLTVPISVGLIMWVLYLVFFPGLSLVLPGVPV